MLRNERYRGVLTWGRREKAYRGGTKVRIARDRCDWTVVECPDLRIVPEDLWFATQARIAESRHASSPKGGRPHRYLLSGLARCGECGGPLTVVNHKSGSELVKVYTCAYHRERGSSVCRSTIRRPVDAMNQSVVAWIHERLLTEDLARETVGLLRARLKERANSTSSDVPELEAQADTLRTEIDRLVRALASTDARPAPVITAIAERQKRLSTLEARLRATKAAPEAIQLDRENVVGRVQ